jgi:hypothetical protein
VIFTGNPILVNKINIIFVKAYQAAEPSPLSVREERGERPGGEGGSGRQQKIRQGCVVLCEISRVTGITWYWLVASARDPCYKLTTRCDN